LLLPPGRIVLFRCKFALSYLIIKLFVCTVVLKGDYGVRKSIKEQDDVRFEEKIIMYY
jgi:hypothetical protein